MQRGLPAIAGLLVFFYIYTGDCIEEKKGERHTHIVVVIVVVAVMVTFRAGLNIRGDHTNVRLFSYA